MIPMPEFVLNAAVENHRGIFEKKVPFRYACQLLHYY